MQTVTICSGLPASGKSTWAKEQVRKGNNLVKRINKDDLRAMLDNSRFNGKSERFIEAARNLLLVEALKRGYSVIIDDTNLNPKQIKSIKVCVELYKEESGVNNVRVQIKEFDVSLEECVRRNAKREGISKVPEDVIHTMYNKWLKN